MLSCPSWGSFSGAWAAGRGCVCGGCAAPAVLLLLPGALWRLAAARTALGTALPGLQPCSWFWLVLLCCIKATLLVLPPADTTGIWQGAKPANNQPKTSYLKLNIKTKDS